MFFYRIFAVSGSFRASAGLKNTCLRGREAKSSDEAARSTRKSLSCQLFTTLQISSLIAATRGKGHRKRCLISVYVLYYPTTRNDLARESNANFHFRTKRPDFFAEKPCNTIFKRCPMVVTGLEYLTKGRKSLDEAKLIDKHRMVNTSTFS